MGCLILLLAAFAPRVALGFVWVFSNLVDRAFSGFFVPLLGLIFLPCTTLFYVLAWSPVGGVSAAGWLFVASGAFLDISHWVSSGYAGRRRYATA